jgi:hypothetical protein
MTPQDRLRISIATARYLEALEQDDQATLNALWAAATGDAELVTAFRDIHAGLLEEQEAQFAQMTNQITAAAEKHLTAGEVLPDPLAPLTVAAAAEELFRQPPDRLPAEAHLMNERLRVAHDPLPTDLGLTDFIVWAEQKYGPAPVEYWKALRTASIKLELRRDATVNYQLAARRAAKPKEGKR